MKLEEREPLGPASPTCRTGTPHGDGVRWRLQSGSHAGSCPLSKPMCGPHAPVLGPAALTSRPCDARTPVRPARCTSRFRCPAQLFCVSVPGHEQHRRENQGASLSSPKPSLGCPGTGDGGVSVSSSLVGPHRDRAQAHAREARTHLPLYSENALLCAYA